VKRILERIALLLCTISLVPRVVRARPAIVRKPEWPGDPGERGDVPGWVMITLMSAVLVAALLAIAVPALEGLFNQAMDKVGQ
jgi:hypothetical protein